MASYPLQEIRATEILQGPLEGGTTKPFLVLAENGKRYVVKLFGRQHSKQRCYTGAEVCAYLLARAFDLFIPDAVLIIVPEELIQQLKFNNPELYDQLQKKDLRPSFASEYMEGLSVFSSATDDRLLDSDEFETIFAFDTLILNEDRRPMKPNILRGETHYFLIDHDKAFEGSRTALEYYNKGQLLQFHNYHLFFEKLQKKEKKDADSVHFETFFEYLRSLDTKTVRHQLERLSELGYSVGECNEWIDYIETCKKICSKFVSLLKKHIQS